MKRVFLLITCLCVMAVNTFSQEKGDMAAGGNLGIATGDGVTSFGIGGKFQYSFTNQLRGEGLFTYYLGDVNFWDLSVNAHYLFSIPTVDKLKLYPLAGFSLMNYKGGIEIDWDNTDPIWEDVIDIEDDGSSVSFGFNLGGGVQYELTSNLYLQGELKYRIGESGTNKFMFLGGVVYKF